MKKIIPLTLALMLSSWLAVGQVRAESICTGVPVAGNYTVSTNDALGCYIATPGTINGVDDAGSSESSTTNSAKLVVPEGKSFTIPSGTSSNSPTTLVVGSLEIQDGGSVSVGSQFSQIKIGVPLYMLDADSDGRPDSLSFYDATASGRRRRSLAADMSENDCSPNNATKWKIYSGYVDNDHDGFGVGSINTNICSGSTIDTSYVANNNTDCNDDNASIYRGVAGYIDTDADGYGTGTYKTCVGDASAYVANNTDCNDTLAATTGKKAFGTICTPTAYGSSDDGAVTFSGAQNINTFVNTGRSYADGISYAVSSIGTNTITTSATPNGIAYGDEIMIINLQGDSTNYSNTGNYENFYVTGVSGNVITLYSNLTKTYGVGSNNNLTGQKIIVQRVPNYSNVTVANGATLTANAWDGTKGGVFAFRASDTATITGTITMTGKGYRGKGGLLAAPGGESFCGYNAGVGGDAYVSGNGYAGSCGGGGGAEGAGTYELGGGAGGSVGGAGGGGGLGYWSCLYNYGGSGGGGGYGTPGLVGGSAYPGANGGTNVSGGGGLGTYTGGRYYQTEGSCLGGGGGGGGTYGSATLSKLYFGSAGGSGGSGGSSSPSPGTGGAGGGIAFINAYNLIISGAIQNNGADGLSGYSTGSGGGGGAGGSIYIKKSTGSGTNITVTGGAGGSYYQYTGRAGGTGGSGRLVTE